jgi:hypothetical protein
VRDKVRGGVINITPPPYVPVMITGSSWTVWRPKSPCGGSLPERWWMESPLTDTGANLYDSAKLPPYNLMKKHVCTLLRVQRVCYRDHC